MSHTQLSLYHRDQCQTPPSHSRVLIAANMNSEKPLAAALTIPLGPEPGPMSADTSAYNLPCQLSPLIALAIVLVTAIGSFTAVSWFAAQLVGMLLAIYM